MPPWPLPVIALSPVCCGSVLWKRGDRLLVTVVVKATLGLSHQRVAWPIAPLEIAREDSHASSLPASPLETASDLSPYPICARVISTRRISAWASMPWRRRRRVRRARRRWAPPRIVRMPPMGRTIGSAVIRSAPPVASRTSIAAPAASSGRPSVRKTAPRTNSVVWAGSARVAAVAAARARERLCGHRSSARFASRMASMRRGASSPARSSAESCSAAVATAPCRSWALARSTAHTVAADAASGTSCGRAPIAARTASQRRSAVATYASAKRCSVSLARSSERASHGASQARAATRSPASTALRASMQRRACRWRGRVRRSSAVSSSARLRAGSRSAEKRRRVRKKRRSAASGRGPDASSARVLCQSAAASWCFQGARVPSCRSSATSGGGARGRPTWARRRARRSGSGSGAEGACCRGRSSRAPIASSTRQYRQEIRAPAVGAESGAPQCGQSRARIVWL
ncbi:uncharacterized protein SOCEGT47_002440 [Sorangium cellulosum]|uniref:Uncharacterized protein n=1 Tax=Sorangium cellulosum TaxID=56 RepID=A0A4P2PTK0_SORCE|nr:uncharacterized protein SOCEGT47_002440 [Sorangium cellulosum]